MRSSSRPRSSILPAADCMDSATGVTVELDRGVHIAALRFFDAEALCARIGGLIGGVPPPALGMVRGRFTAGGTPYILAWRSPTECWLLCEDAAPIEALRRELAQSRDACLVVQTGGILAVTVSGARTQDLMCRLGSPASLPRPGEARTGRFADVTVTVVGLADTELLLLVDRAYADHLLEWIRATIADFQ